LEWLYHGHIDGRPGLKLGQLSWKLPAQFGQIGVLQWLKSLQNGPEKKPGPSLLFTIQYCSELRPLVVISPPSSGFSLNGVGGTRRTALFANTLLVSGTWKR
jgi:hypothetical protein